MGTCLANRVSLSPSFKVIYLIIKSLVFFFCLSCWNTSLCRVLYHPLTDEPLSLYAKLRTKTSDLLYRNIFYRLGHGRPVARNAWEESYSIDYWDYIEDEKARYHAIAKFFHQCTPNASVLDVGCGKGGLYQYLNNSSSGLAYTGIDISENAVAAAAKRFPQARFRQLDFDQQAFDKKFDLVVFNEVIEFFERPVKTLQKCADANLHKGGSIIISMYQGHEALWKQIGKHFPIAAAVEVENERGNKWKIKLLNPL